MMRNYGVSICRFVLQATSILQSQGLGGLGGSGTEVRTNYCNVPLPEKQAMAPKDSDVS